MILKCRGRVEASLRREDEGVTAEILYRDQVVIAVYTITVVSSGGHSAFQDVWLRPTSPLRPVTTATRAPRECRRSALHERIKKPGSGMNTEKRTATLSLPCPQYTLTSTHFPHGEQLPIAGTIYPPYSASPGPPYP
jgi:hypothetical protein